MHKNINTQIKKARAYGEKQLKEQPYAVSALYDAEKKRIVIELSNGVYFEFPPKLAQGLKNAKPEQLATVEILGIGYGLHWKNLDVDLSIPSLMAGIFGTASYMAHKAGKISSPLKAEAARRNGALGGRPRKSAAMS